MLYSEDMADRNPDWWPYAAEFPHWEVWRDVDRLYYARLSGSEPQVVVRGEDAVDLRDQVRAVILRARTCEPGHEWPGRPGAAGRPGSPGQTPAATRC
jgi:hypothetical protein